MAKKKGEKKPEKKKGLKAMAEGIKKATKSVSDVANKIEKDISDFDI